MEQLSEVYYKPKNIWKGSRAISKLHKLTEISRKNVKEWIAKQALWQVHLPVPKQVDHPHFTVKVPNQQHQFDVLYMPHDKFQGSVYKYILTGVDVASRYKVAKPLRTKKASDVAFLLKNIYKSKDNPLKWPEVFQCDNGNEFKAEVTKLLESHDVKINRVTTKYKHTHTAFVENFNKVLAEKLFMIMDSKELQTGEDSKKWMKHLLSGLVDEMNKEKNSMTGLAPTTSIKRKIIELKHKYPTEDVLPEDGLYRYLYLPGEQHRDQKKRATDLNWSKKTYRLDRIVEESGNRVMYYLKDGPERAFVREELMLIPENTELPPEYVKEW